MKLSIIIPVYNEEKTIKELLKRIILLKIPSLEKEIIIIDDGSTDATASKIKEQRLKNKDFIFIQHKKNLGKGAAIQSGIKSATGEYIVIQDADLEYNPNDIEKLLKPISERKAKVVYGTRLKRMPHFSKEEKEILFLLQYLGNKFLSLVTSILYGVWLTDMETCYKIFPRTAVISLNLQARSFDFEPEITAKLLKSGFSITEIPITTIPRSYKEGKKLRAFQDGSIALWTLIKYRFIN